MSFKIKKHVTVAERRTLTQIRRSSRANNSHWIVLAATLALLAIGIIALARIGLFGKIR